MNLNTQEALEGLQDLLPEAVAKVRRERLVHCLAFAESEGWEAFSPAEEPSGEPCFLLEPKGKREEHLIPLSAEAESLMGELGLAEAERHFALLAEVEEEQSNAGYFGVRGR